MYERLLVAIDHSETSKRVLDATEELARKTGAEVFVLHLRERESLSRLGLVPDESADEAKEPVAAAVRSLQAAGVKADGAVVETIYGSAAKEIVDSAKLKDASVIILGSRGLSTLEGLIVGSTTHKVLHLSDRPVLVVR